MDTCECCKKKTKKTLVAMRHRRRPTKKVCPGCVSAMQAKGYHQNVPSPAQGEPAKA